MGVVYDIVSIAITAARHFSLRWLKNQRTIVFIEQNNQSLLNKNNRNFLKIFCKWVSGFLHLLTLLKKFIPVTVRYCWAC